MKKNSLKKYLIIPFLLFFLSFFILSPINLSNYVNAHPNLELYVGGQPIGVKLTTNGVLIVGLSEVEDEKGDKIKPAYNAGLRVGDNILELNGKKVNNSEQLSYEVKKSNGQKIKLLIERKGEKINIEINPIKSKKDGKYKIGLWVRDSVAGIGTLTFYEKETGKFGGLGHAITDVDTGEILRISKGEIIPSSIISVKKGYKGEPGELKGIFIEEKNQLGYIDKNTQCGIFGTAQQDLINDLYKKPLKVGYRNEVKEGPAKMITTINGDVPREYDIEIQQIFNQNSPTPKSMIVKVVDKELLQKTGGIVQGMSGSPIVQNGKIVGAITHVLINKPDMGYGIYIEWMLKEADITIR